MSYLNTSIVPFLLFFNFLAALHLNSYQCQKVAERELGLISPTTASLR